MTILYTEIRNNNNIIVTDGVCSKTSLTDKIYYQNLCQQYFEALKCGPNTSPNLRNIDNKYIFHSISDDRFVYLCLSDMINFSPKSVRGFILKVQYQWNNTVICNTLAPGERRPTMAEIFVRIIPQLMEEVNNEPKILDTINNDYMVDLKDTLSETVRLLKDREYKLTMTDKLTSDLNVTTDNFSSESKKSCWTICSDICCLLITILVILDIISIFVCGDIYFLGCFKDKDNH